MFKLFQCSCKVLAKGVDHMGTGTDGEMNKVAFKACLESLSMEHSTAAADMLFDTIDLDRVRSIAGNSPISAMCSVCSHAMVHTRTRAWL